MSKPTKIPGIPKPPSSLNPATRQYLEVLAEAVEIRLGRKGDPRDRAITLRELIESGLAVDLKAAPFDPNNPNISNMGFGTNEIVDSSVPPPPTSFTVAAAYSQVILSWDYPNYSNHSFTEIYGHSSDVIGDAQLIGVSTGRVYIDPIGSGASRYYWIRHVSTSSIQGPWNSGTGTLGQTATDVAHQINVLSGAITSSELATSLATPIGNLPANTNTEISSLQSQINTLTNVAAWASGTAYALTDLVTYSGNLYECTTAHTASNSNKPTGSSSNNSYWTFVGAYSSLAAAVAGNTSSISDVNYISSSSNSAAAVKIASLDATVNDSATGLSATATALSNLSTTVSTQGTSINTVASDVSTLSTSVGNNSTSISTQATSINGLQGQYSVKIDNNDHVSGFGLSSTAVDGTPTSAFIVRADKFAVIDPANTSTGLTNSPPADTVPFFIDSGNTYIKTAMIEDASITNAKIGDLSADKINTGTLSANRIGTNSIDASKIKLDGASITSNSSGQVVIGSISAGSITSGTLNASNVTISNLYADNISGDINLLTPFSIPSAVQITGGDTQIWAGQFAAQTKAKKPYVSAVGFGIWENDVVYKMKLQMKPNVGSTTTTVGSITGATSFTIYGYTSYNVQVSGDKQSIVFAGGTLKIGSSVRGTVYSTSYDSTNNRTNIFYTPQNGGFTTSNVGSTLSIQTANAWQDVSTIMFRSDYDDHPEPFAISGGLTTAYTVTVDVRIMADTYYTNYQALPSTPHNTNWNLDQVFALDGLMMSLR